MFLKMWVLNKDYDILGRDTLQNQTPRAIFLALRFCNRRTGASDHALHVGFNHWLRLRVYQMTDNNELVWLLAICLDRIHAA